MTETSSLDFAKFGFKKRGKRFVLTGIAVAYVVLALALGAIFLAATWSFWSPLIDWYFAVMRDAESGADPQMPPMETVMGLAPFWALSSFIGLILYAAFEAANLRWMVRGESGGGLLGLSFGADTWRVFAIYWIWGVLWIVFMVGVACFYLGLRMFAGIHPAAQIVSLVLAALAPLGLACLMIWLGVRLAPAAALSVRDKRLAFFGAWGATRGRFWPMLGGFVIAMVAYLVVSWIAQQVMSIPFAVGTHDLMGDMMRGGSSEEVFRAAMSTFMSPTFIALGLLFALVSQILTCVFYVSWFGINACAVTPEEDAVESPPVVTPAPAPVVAVGPVEAPPTPTPPPVAEAAAAPEPAPEPEPEPAVEPSPAEPPIAELAPEAPPEAAPPEASEPAPAPEAVAPEPTPDAAPEQTASEIEPPPEEKPPSA